MIRDGKGLVALLGRPDHPADGVKDYCDCLKEALGRQGIELEVAKLSWDKEGWARAIAGLWTDARRWRERWVLVQYTALSWSRRGFPAGLLGVLMVLRIKGVRLGIIFHDPSGFPGKRPIDRIRRAVQHGVMTLACAIAGRAVFTIPLSRVTWLRSGAGKAAFVPVGANIPAPGPAQAREDGVQTVAVFGVTGGARAEIETQEIAFAVQRAAEALKALGRRLRLVVLGRGAEESEPLLRSAMAGVDAELEVLGLLPADKAAEVLGSADVLLFVRGPVSTGRGSALAGIACGLPLVSYEGKETGGPITDAGVLLAPQGDRGALAHALARVLTDGELRERLAGRSREAHERWFSWNAVSGRLLEALAGSVETNQQRYRVLLVSSHPVQYAAPLYRRMADHPKLDILVAYLSLQGAEKSYDPGFGIEVAWDVPLLDGYPWVEVPNHSPRPGPGRFFGLVNTGLSRLIRKGRFDAVVLYTGYVCASFWIVLALAKLTRTRVLFGTDATRLGPRDGRRWKVPLKRILLPLIFRMADVVISPSTGTTRFVRDLGIREERIMLTPFVTDNDWWRARADEADREAVRKEWEVPLDAAVLLFCAKLQPWKRPQDVLRAFAKAAVPGAYLLFAGEGPLRAELEAETVTLGAASRVRFLGFVNQSELPAIYGASDLLVLPSEYEPCAVAVIEAMVCGCVPIVSNEVWRGRQDTVRNGETGFVFPVGDVAGLAHVIREALSDPGELSRLRKAGRDRMQTWGPRESVEALVDAVGCAAGRKHA